MLLFFSFWLRRSVVVSDSLNLEVSFSCGVENSALVFETRSQLRKGECSHLLMFLHCRSCYKKPVDLILWSVYVASTLMRLLCFASQNRVG